MAKFKVGDRVIGNKKASTYSITTPGSEWIVKGYEDGRLDIGYYVNEDCFDLITNKINMNLKEKFITAFLSEPEKTYRKAGITNSDGIITTEGQELLLTYLLKKNPEFKTEVVDVLLLEEKDEK